MQRPAQRPPHPTPTPQRPAQPPTNSQPSKPSLPEPVEPKEEADVTEVIDVEEAENESILEEQLLGTPRRRSRGLQPVEETVEESATEINLRTSSKAMEIIEASKARANASWDEKKGSESSTAPAAQTQTKPKPSRRRQTTSFQPAAREKRLDRSRHMEYKYEVRGLLQELDVAEEHRSSLLGTIWAKGERQTSADARQFILDKQSEGILNQDQTDSLMAIVDDYTIRR